MSTPPLWWDVHVKEDLDRLKRTHLFRERKIIRLLDATHIELDGRQLTNFASNNYLGLTHHPALIAAAKSAIDSDGTGSAAAPLISGYGHAHRSAEKSIAQWKGTGNSVLFPSGYQANFAAIQTAAAIGKLRGGARFLVDKLAHASLIDAIRGSGEPFRVFPHNHIAKLRRLLEEHPAAQLQVVVTESIFSMDGDAADLIALAELKREHGFMLIVDEAHATGVYGPEGNGLAAELGVQASVDVTVITLSKAMGGIGGAVCASATFCEVLINYGRAYLFSTSVPPATAAVAEAAVEVIREEPARRTRVRELARIVRSSLTKLGFAIAEGDCPIVPVILGDEATVLAAAESLRVAGLFVAAVRPPTVPKNASRLRVTLCSEHTDVEVENLVQAISSLRRATFAG